MSNTILAVFPGLARLHEPKMQTPPGEGAALPKGDLVVSESYSAKRKSVSTAPYGARDVDALRSEVVMVTPQMAALLRQDCHFERQRPINTNNVSRLASEMSRGWFIRGTPIYVCVLPDKTMRLVNGNHTLEAVKQSGVSIPLVFVYNKVADIEAAAAIYANLDLQKIRTWGNALQAFSGETSTFYDSKVLSALGIIMGDFRSKKGNGYGADPLAASRTARFHYFEEYKETAARLRTYHAGGVMKVVRKALRAPVLAVALVTTRAQPSLAEEFWNGLVKDDGLRSDDPRKALLRFLDGNPISGGDQWGFTLKACALAWNAFFSGRTLSVCKPNQMSVFRLSGTSWHSGAKRPDKPIEIPAAEVESKTTQPMFETGVSVGTNGASRPVARFIQ